MGENVLRELAARAAIDAEERSLSSNRHVTKRFHKGGARSIAQPFEPEED